MATVLDSAEERSVQLEGYCFTEKLYEGSRTVVYRGICESTRTPVVVKFLRDEFPSFNEIAQFNNQFTIVKDLNEARIVKPLGLVPSGNASALVMEDFGGHDLKCYCEENSEALGHSVSGLVLFFQITVQVAEGLETLSRARIIHKDIKPANVLINPESRQVKLIDFSIASTLPRELQDLQNPNVLEGTLAYLSPEQTGRMNRGIDYRSDFYSFGVTCYELLTQQLPFRSQDPMDVVHGHLARQPVAPHQLCEELPKIASDIVLKLMAKNAEDRYQSAFGLKHDLQRCLHDLKAQGQIKPFELGQEDISDRFLLSEKLYGRQREIAHLLAAFERVSAGETELMLIAGTSGIGKTAIVNEVHKPIARQRGYFIQGKYDQLQHNVPLSAFVQAFRALIKLLLSESDAQLERWRSQISAALGRDAQVVIDVIPELEGLIGLQQPAPALDAPAAQNRFNRLIQNFVEVFTSPDHPLVLFLDDLQWADVASLHLLKQLMQGNGYLLIIGTYRDNEVSASHPLMLMLRDLECAGEKRPADPESLQRQIARPTTVNHLVLSALSEQDVVHFVADTLHQPVSAIAPLAKLIHQKTGGNPFFSAQILQSLNDEGHITFDSEQRCWRFDLRELSAVLPSDDVLEFMSLRLQKLPERSQEILQVAACIGAHFSLSDLVAAANSPAQQVIDDLRDVLHEGLIMLTHSSHRMVPTADAAVLSAANPSYRFFHDRIQQAAYRSMTAEQRAAVHRTIGLRLLSSRKKSSRSQDNGVQNNSAQDNKSVAHRSNDGNLFDIVNHLNEGISLVETTAERDRLIKLNLNAGRKAKAATAHDASLKYFNIGICLLPPDGWKTHYRLKLTLHQQAAEAAYLEGNLVDMQQHVDEVLQHAKTLLDKTPTYETQIQAAIGQNHLLAGVEVSLQVLAQLNVDIPPAPSTDDIAAALQQTNERIRRYTAGRSVTTLVDLPETEDPESVVIIRLLARAVSAAYIAKPEVLPLLVCAGINRCLDGGHTPLSAFLYTWYGVVLCSNPASIPKGCEMGQLSLDLLEKIPAKEVSSRVVSIAYFFVLPWQTPLKDMLVVLEDNYSSSLENGDREYAAWSLCNHATLAFLVGAPLDQLADKLALFRDSIYHLQQDAAFNYLSIYYQVVLNLLDQSNKPTEIEGDAYQKSKQLPMQMAACDFSGLAFFYINEGVLRYLFGRIEQAWSSFDSALKYIDGATSSQWLPLFYFYDSLVCLARIEDEQSAQVEARIEANQAKLNVWATLAPSNHRHRWHLVEAERYRLAENKAGAIEAYEQAIALANAQDFIHEAALANEIAAKFYLMWNKGKVAQGYMIDAYYGYSRWGARAKIAHLEDCYPVLLEPALQKKQQNISSTDTILAYANSTRSTTTSNTGISEVIDLKTLLYTSQIISREIELEKLLAALIEAAIQNAGADKCALLMPQENEWDIEAYSDLSNPSVLLRSKSLSAGRLLPMSLINQVRHTCESAVIFNASVHAALAVDPYVLREKPKSILCTPLLNQNKLIAILYLENNLTIGAFTDQRVEVLNLICTQAAISLENARLYQQAQQALEELQSSHMQLVQSEKMSALGSLVAGIAHEINNPVNFLKGNIKPALNYSDDLIGLLDMVKADEPRADILEAMEAINLPFIREDLPNLLHSMTFGISRIRDISTSLRTFSRSDKEHKTAFNLHEGLDSTLLILKHRIQQGDGLSPIEIIKHYDPNLPEIECFAGQLNQVFMNLIANAIEALIEQNGGEADTEGSDNKNTITITTNGLMSAAQAHEEQDLEGQAPELVRISIADNGPGMSETVKSRVFEHLFTTKPVGVGTGLGLSISNDIVVNQHSGRLLVESAEGEGTVFVIELPVEAPENEAPENEAPENEAPER